MKCPNFTELVRILNRNGVKTKTTNLPLIFQDYSQDMSSYIKQFIQVDETKYEFQYLDDEIFVKETSYRTKVSKVVVELVGITTQNIVFFFAQDGSFKVSSSKSEREPSRFIIQEVASRLDAIFLRAAQIVQHEMNQIMYFKSLNEQDSMTLLQYKWYGDQLINLYLRNTLTVEGARTIFRRYAFRTERHWTLFPLEAQAKAVHFDIPQFITMIRKHPYMYAPSTDSEKIYAAEIDNIIKSQLEPMILKFIADLQRIIQNAPRGFSVILYRGIDSESLDRSNKTFISTSTRLEIAKRFVGIRCCLLTFQVFSTFPLLSLNAKTTEILVKKVLPNRTFEDGSNRLFFEDFYLNQLKEDEVLILSNTPVVWKNFEGTIETAMENPAQRRIPFFG